MERDTLLGFLKVYQGERKPSKEGMQFMIRQVTANWPIQRGWFEKINCKESEKTGYFLLEEQISCVENCLNLIWLEDWSGFINEFIQFVESGETTDGEIHEAERQVVHMFQGMLHRKSKDVGNAWEVG